MRKMIIITFFLISTSHSLKAEIPIINETDFYSYRPASIECVIEASRRQGVPANILLSLASLESGKNGQRVTNTNGSVDIGHFQLNTINWKDGKFAGVLDISENDVALRGCYNAELAAWILKSRINENNGQDFWTRVANYHSKTKKFNDIYKAKLMPLAIRWGNWLEKRGEYTVTFR
ncbi:transglycosylase SLT domain-containing protein [Yersinia enterocolitica]|uniref:transglycosylase SLT domain-containing protein n=1 Tax=Yersinia TaxID=629 RepID=UPI0005E626EA|nr:MULTISPECIES: transglycosylase SLT domain-containing protein [Yersinia]MCW6576381.1 transglycosylase SLT domain-containing protein [Yersinia ruckeri]CND60848.1 putative conjugal transfer protein TrbN [Yersinia pseudotuberculosis]CQH79890.1 putative conjugal transfer protein TrbN [Yersinia enterocolitica]